MLEKDCKIFVQEKIVFRQSANSFCQDPNIKNPQKFPQVMEQYEKEVCQTAGQQYVQRPQFQNSQLAVPQPNTLVDHFFRNTFVGDQGQMQQYSQAIEQTKQHEENSKPIQQKNLLMDYQLGNQFVPIPQNYLDYNVNSKCLGGIDKQPTYLRDPVDLQQFQKVQLQYMQSINDPSPPEQAKLFKQNIQELGGIEDTIGSMTQTLNQFEIKHLVNKNIKYYPLTSPPPTPEQLIQIQQAQSIPHPFIYNPADDKDRYVYGPLKPAQQIIDQQNTQTSQFYQTLRQDNQINERNQIREQLERQQQFQQQTLPQHIQFDSIEQSKRLRLIKLQQLQSKK